MNSFISIARYTIGDQMRHKSFFALLALSILLVLTIRGCHDAVYTVDGKVVDPATVTWYVSKMAFHMVSAGMFLMITMLSMKTFSRDHEDGSMVLFLSRPVSRWQYVFGRVTGTWALCFVFMFILHMTIVLTAWAKTGIVFPGYVTASLVSSINLFFVNACVCCLSLFLPDFISGVFTVGILFVGFVSDGGYQIFNSDILRSALPASVNPDPSLWRILYPKVFMVQAYADTMISKSTLHGMGPFHPLLNLSFYIVLTMIFMLGRFNRKEI